MSINRNKLLIDLGNKQKSQIAAVELLLHDFCMPTNSILPLEILPLNDDKITIKLYTDNFAEEKIIDVQKLVYNLQKGKQPILFVLETLYVIPATNHASSNFISDSNTYDTIKKLCENSVLTQISEKVCERAEAGASTRLIGESASGKTISVAQVICRLRQIGWSFSWIDLSEPTQNVYTLLLDLIKTQRNSSGKHIVVIDDSQANPTGLKEISTILVSLRNNLQTEIIVIVIGWESAINNIKECFPYTSQINCYGDLLIPSIVDGIFEHEIPTRDLEQIRESCGGDLFIAKLLAEYKRKNNSFPSQKQLAALAFSNATNQNELNRNSIELLYVLSSLSQFEIDTHKDYAIAYNEIAFNYLLKIQSVRLNNDYLSVGHRTLAKLIILYLQNEKKDIIYSLPESNKIAVKYLKTASPSQIVSTLERLDVASLAYSKTDQHGATFLARAWESLTILVNYVSRETINDPTWRNNTGSAAFAAIALMAIGNINYPKILHHLYSKWDISGDTDLPSPSIPIPTEHFDFIEIKKTMFEEENVVGKTYSTENKAENIDLIRMHNSWVLGLLLCVSGYTPYSNSNTQEKLINLARRAQCIDGSFYPSRVPWVTARVLIGLASVGESVRSSEVVKKACEWLCRSYPEGPYKLGLWEPGTGKWNTTLETTAMCVNALIRCGVPSTDPHVKAGISYLKGKKSVWATQGKEIDGAFAVETILAVEGRWRSVNSELNMLLSWIQHREAWEGDVVKISNVSHDQSCKISQISSSLIRIVWDTVKRELPLLLEGLSVSKYSMLTDDIDDSIKNTYEQVIEQIERLKRKIDSEIRSRVDLREQKDNVPEIQKMQVKWEERKKKLRSIEGFMHTISSQRDSAPKETISEIIVDINSLGNECFEKTWQPIKLGVI